MKNIIGSIWIGITTGLAGIAPAVAQDIKIGIAAEAYPPFASPDASGNWHGWEIDFAKAVCSEAKLDCVISPVSWDGIIPALTTGKINMIVASMSITEERLKVIDFSDSYYNAPDLVIGLKNLAIDASPNSMGDKVIGVQASTIHQTYTMKHFVPKGAIVREYQTQDEANSDLAAGRIDATVGDSIALSDFLKTDAGRACCDEKGNLAPDDAVLGTGVGIGLRKGEDALKGRLNAAIKAIQDNGIYQAFSAKYFAYDVRPK